MSFTRTRWWAIVITLVCGASCDQTTPTQVPNPNIPPAAPPAASVVGIDLRAPARIAPGESVQLVATLVRSDGSREDASDIVVWSAESAVLQVNGGGIARGIAAGESTVTATFAASTATARILVLPAETYKLSGIVSGAGAPIAGATVSVLSGRGSGLTTTTNGWGGYVFYGVGGSVELQIKRDGLLNKRVPVDVNDNQTLDVQLDADPSSTAGMWTLTVTAGPCSSGQWTLPDSVRRRTYTAFLTEKNGPRVSITGTLTGGEFISTYSNVAGNAVQGFRDPALPFIQIGFFEPFDDYGIGYGLLERLSADRALAIVGLVHTQWTPSAIEGTFAGSFRLLRPDEYGWYTTIAASCDSTAHEFKMRR